MSLCAVKRGIITLRDCGQEAGDTCTTCARPVCREHMKVSAGSVLCVECYARREEEALKQSTKQSKGGGKAPTPANTRTRQDAGDEWEDPVWPYTYRHSYYMTSHYTPFYTGSYYDSYYNDYDVRSFHHGATGDSLHDEGEGVGDFYES